MTKYFALTGAVCIEILTSWFVWFQHQTLPSIMSPVPIYTPGWRETRWNKVLVQGNNDGRDQARTTDLQVESPTH